MPVGMDPAVLSVLFKVPNFSRASLAERACQASYSLRALWTCDLFSSVDLKLHPCDSLLLLAWNLTFNGTQM